MTPAAELIAKAGNHRGDRHVLAAAIDAGAKDIVTFNLRHFRPEALAPWKIKAVSPDEFLLELYSLNPTKVRYKLALMGRRDSEAKTLELLRKHAPGFVARFEGA